MIKHKTVLILGAGASKPYSLPLGQELRDDVIKGADKIGLLSTLSRVPISQDEFASFATDLSESGFPSVDAFLEHRQKWIPIGKAAIALCLLRSEAKSREKLFPPHQPKDHWYEALWARLRAPSWQGFKQNPWHVITFNYDRSLEHYLVRVLCNNYCLKPHTVCSQLPILHVHGSLGDYDAFPYGGRIGAVEHEIAANSIRVVHESDVGKSEFTRAQTLVEDADRVLFLGFGFHEENMKKLAPNKFNGLVEGLLVMGTHKRIKARQWDRICRKYRFSLRAYNNGAGSIAEFVTDWME